MAANLACRRAYLDTTGILSRLSYRDIALTEHDYLDVAAEAGVPHRNCVNEERSDFNSSLSSRRAFQKRMSGAARRAKISTVDGSARRYF